MNEETDPSQQPSKASGTGETPLLALLTLILNRLLSGYRLDKWMLSAKVELELIPGGIQAWMNVGAGDGLVSGRYPLEFRIEETTAEQTVFSMQLRASGGISQVVRFIGKSLPKEFINERLQDFLGEAIRLEGERFILSHQALIRRFTQPGMPTDRQKIT
ncbi:MAG: hypothetical protein OEZ59_13230 [Deltaproteobacteria bacterium]|nr:hypothetical protein [Deltaproteobacteria bacterium]